MDYFYDGQIRRYVTQFMRVFIGFKYKTGGDVPEERNVPVMYGDMTRMVASIIKDNSENKMSTVPRIACYITGIEMDKERLSDSSFVSKVNIRERAYTKNTDTGLVEYQNIQGGNYTVERLMPTPFKLSMKADIWTSSTDQKLQLLEQILVLFNPSLEIQTTDNYIDWTSLSVINLGSVTFTSRAIPQGAETEIDVCTLEFDMPVWISPPAKVKRLGIVKAIINNAFTETGDVVNLEGLVYNRATGSFNTTTNNYRVLLFKSNTGDVNDLQYDVTIADPAQAILSMGLDQKQLKIGNPIDWHEVLGVQGGYTPGSQMYFDQPNGHSMVGTFVINPLEPSTIVVTFDRDTVPQNTLITDDGVISNSGRGTVDAIIDPYKFNPKEVWGADIPTTIRYLMLDDVNNSVNVSGTIRDGVQYDGPDGWKNADGSDPVIKANTIIRWDGTAWVTVFDPYDLSPPIYLQNLRTGIKYRWTGQEWLKAFEGEYAPNYWGFYLDPK